MDELLISIWHVLSTVYLCRVLPLSGSRSLSLSLSPATLVMVDATDDYGGDWDEAPTATYEQPQHDIYTHDNTHDAPDNNIHDGNNAYADYPSYEPQQE